MSRLISTTASILLWWGIACAAEPERATRAIAIVVGRDSPVRTMTRDTLREIFLRRQRVWPDGSPVIPINLPPASMVRDEFSRLVLGRSTQDTVAYWNGRYFEGIVPPQVLPSAAAIRGFLAAEPGAVAYLPLSEVDDSCRTLLVLEARNPARPPAATGSSDP